MVSGLSGQNGGIVLESWVRVNATGSVGEIAPEFSMAAFHAGETA